VSHQGAAGQDFFQGAPRSLACPSGAPPQVCTLVKTFEQFVDEGCDNCEAFLGMAERQDRVSELTTHTFEG